ncbi:cupin domain-containing protein [Candidatus Bathyarchaeota archaeon]|nr:cupin domain-containing protein [Candidatus Bathyarchaeota archaeon]
MRRLSDPNISINFALRYFVFQPRGYLPPHKHPLEREIIVVKGTLETTSGGRTVKNEPGDIVYISADEEHGFRNIGEETCEFYCIIGCVGEGENCIDSASPTKVKTITHDEKAILFKLGLQPP